MHSRGLWPAENISGQWMQVQPIDVVRIQKKPDLSRMNIRKLYSRQLCGVHGSRHRCCYLWLQPLLLQQPIQWEWGESEQGEYTTSKGIHEGLTCQSSSRIWPWRRLLNTTTKMISRQCEESRGHGSSFGNDWVRKCLLINGAPAAAETGAISPISQMPLSLGCRTRICKVAIVSATERERQTKSNHLTVLSRVALKASG